MKHALHECERALSEYRESSWHQRLNIMTQFFEGSLPIVISEMKRKMEDELNDGASETDHS